MTSRLALAPLALALVLALALLLWSPPARLVQEGGVYFTMSPDAQRELGEMLRVPEEGFYLFCFVREGCPYCALQLEFFEKHYPGSFGKCDIVAESRCLDSLIAFLEESNLIALVRGVPLTLAFRDGRLLAVVEGLSDKPEFWKKIESASPTEEIPLIYGGQTPQVLRCFTQTACVPDEALLNIKLSLATLTIAAGITASMTIHIATTRRR